MYIVDFCINLMTISGQQLCKRKEQAGSVLKQLNTHVVILFFYVKCLTISSVTPYGCLRLFVPVLLYFHDMILARVQKRYPKCKYERTEGELHFEVLGDTPKRYN